MSAYALAGIFPALPFTFPNAISTSTQPHSDERNYRYENAEYAREPVTQDPNGLSRSKATGIAITVKDTKIDTMLLIQLLTTATTTATSFVRKNSQSEQHTILARRRMSPTSSSEAIDTASASFSSPQERAMKFELDVVHQGEQRTLIRSLHRIRQLSDDLMMEEMCQAESVQTATKSIRSEDSSSCTFSELVTFSGRGSLLNQSFASLHTLAQSYAPDIENWLRKAVGRPGMDRSPMLTDFLSEPMCLIPILVHQCSSDNRTDEDDNRVVPSVTTIIPKSSRVYTKSGSRHFRRNSSLASIEEQIEERFD